MCNLNIITKGQAAIIGLTRAMRETTGNLPPMRGVFLTTWHPSSPIAAAFLNCVSCVGACLRPRRRCLMPRPNVQTSSAPRQ